MDLERLALFALTEFLLCLSPGPAVFLVIGLSLRQGFAAGAAATGGILLTNAVYFALSALGVGAVILASATAFTILKWIGAAYLVYLGIGMLRPLVLRLFGREVPEASAEEGKAVAPAGPPTRDRAQRRAFLRGAMIQASNPKNIAFFVAILPQFIDPEGALAVQILLMGAVSVFLEAPILLAYALLASASGAFARARLIAWIEGAAGALLIGFGGALALAKRSP